MPVVDVKTAKVFLFDEAYSLTEDQVITSSDRIDINYAIPNMQAAAVSDHYPVEVHIRAT